MRTSTCIGSFALVSYVILFFGIWGEPLVAQTGVVLLIVMNVIAFLLTLPPEYARWKGARRAVQHLLAGPGIGIKGYPRSVHNSVSLFVTGFLSIVALIAIIMLMNATVMRVPNLGFTVLTCILLGMLIARMQLAHELESGTEGRIYFSRQKE